METIYDVIRLLVAKARPMLTDAQIGLAHEIIDRHEKAIPAPGPDQEAEGDAETHT